MNLVVVQHFCVAPFLKQCTSTDRPYVELHFKCSSYVRVRDIQFLISEILSFRFVGRQNMALCIRNVCPFLCWMFLLILNLAIRITDIIFLQKIYLRLRFWALEPIPDLYTKDGVVFSILLPSSKVPRYYTSLPLFTLILDQYRTTRHLELDFHSY